MAKYLPPILLSTLFFIIYAANTLHRHLTYQSHAFDLGIYSQAIYLYSQGELAFSTLKHMVILADHFGLILVLLAPIYKLFPDPTTLLIIQALFVAGSGIPIYLIAQDKLKNSSLAILLSLVYLSSIGILKAVIFDFHLATISVLPLSLILYAWNFKKWRLYWFGLLISLIFKEDVPIFILGIGVFELLRKQFSVGIPTIVLAIVSFYLIKFQLMPFFWPGSENYYLSTSILPLDSPTDLIFLLFIRPNIFLDQFMNSPVKLATFENLYREFAYLPLLSPLSWLTTVPYLFLRFTSSYTQLWGISFHHNANLAPFLVISTILAIEKYKIPAKPVMLLLLFFLLTGFVRGNLVTSTLHLDYKNFEQYSYIDAAIKNIPPMAAVSAQSPIVPHLINRTKIYMYPETLDAEYLIFNYNLNGYPLGQQQLRGDINSLRNSKYWRIFYSEKSLVIFKKI